MMRYLIEIKNRLILILIAVISTLILSYYYKDVLLFILIKPVLKNSFNLFYFIFTDVTEIFSVYIKVISFFINQIFLIFLIFQTFSFLSLAFFIKEYIFFKQLLKSCLVIWFFSFFLAGSLLIPFSWEFFFCFQNIISSKFISLYFEPKIIDYISFCITIYSMTIFYFQLLAILIFVIVYYNNNITFIKRYKKFYYYIFIIFATFITPPDIFSQLIIGLCLIIFYECFTVGFIIKSILARKIIKTN